LQKKYPVMGDVRGMGLMQGVELVEDPVSKTPAPQLALRLMEGARENRILIGRGGLHGNVIRISPPLNIQKSDVDEFSRRLEAAFRSLQ
jgi:4-aminobutyrate aminotransferase-like enzyme